MATGYGTWMYAIAVVVGSFVVGLAIDLLLARILLRQGGPELRARQSLGRSLKGHPEVWAVLIGLTVFKPFTLLPTNGQEWISRLIIIAAVVSVTTFCTQLAGWMLRAYLRQDSVTAPSGTIFVNLARLVIWAVGIATMLSALGVALGPLVASVAFLGLAVSLGLQDTVANFFTGLQMTLSRQIQPGDYIRLSTGQEGVVHDITWRNTTVRPPSGDLVIVPNAILGKAIITNFTTVDQTHTSAVAFTVAYGSDLAHIKGLAEAVAREVRDGARATVKEYEPTCRFTEFTADGVSGSVTIRMDRYRDDLPIVGELVMRLHERLIAEGVALGTIALAEPDAADAAATATT